MPLIYVLKSNEFNAIAMNRTDSTEEDSQSGRRPNTRLLVDTSCTNPTISTRTYSRSQPTVQISRPSVQTISEPTVVPKAKPKPKAFKCCFDKCNQSFDELIQMRQHLATEHKLIKCEKCDQMFVNEDMLSIHRRRVHKIIPLTLPIMDCPLCDTLFTSRPDLDRHIAQHSDGSLTVPKPYSCCKCSERFAKKELLNFHNKSVHYKCQSCAQGFISDNRMKEHMKSCDGRTKSGDQFRCNLCDTYVARDAMDLNNHKLTVHIKSVQYKCLSCTQWFRSTEQTKEHMKSCDGRLKSGLHLGCDLCDTYVAKDLMDLNKHKLTVHMNKVNQRLNAFKCEKCLKSFYTKQLLLTHVSTDHTIRSFECDFCYYKTFNDKDLIQHKAIHLLSGLDRKYKCDINDCNQLFKSNKNLFKHKYAVHLGRGLAKI